MEKPCFYCQIKAKCPIDMKPVENVDVGLVKTYECEELVKLYLKMREIGLFVKESKNGK